MGRPDMSRLAASDAVVALRSLPRRFRAALAPPIGDDRPAADDDLVHRIGPDGHSAIDHLQHVVRTLALLDRAIEQVVVSDDPVLHPAVADDHARWVDPAEQVGAAVEVDDALDDLAAASDRLVARVERVSGAGWARTGRVAGGETVSAHDVLAEAVGSAVDHLRAAERTVDAVRGQL